jgi:Cohesin domain
VEKLKYIVLSVLCLIALGLFLLGCEKVSAPSEVLDNPLDTLSSAFSQPVATIISGPSESQTITVPSVTFTWQGNVGAKEFSYNCDAGGWSVWSAQTSATFDYLDEGTHTFAVRARHHNGITIERNPPQIDFTVDAVKGPSLMFCPRRTSILRRQTFTYDIKAEEVSFMYGTKMSIQYDPTYVTVTGIIAGAMVNSNSGTSILLPTIDSIAHTITIEIATIGRTPKGVSGSGVIATLQCKAIVAGTTLFQFNSTQTLLRDTLNAPITPNTLVQGRVEIQ